MPYVNFAAVCAFNSAAPALDAFAVGGAVFEVFHDYWHKREAPFPASIHVRKVGGELTPWGVDSFPVARDGVGNAFFRNGSRANRDLNAWLAEQYSRHAAA
jgi:hypothetical protein